MSDTGIVERLRATWAGKPYLPSICAEAADEIERLRAALSDIHEHAIMGHDDAADGFIKIAGMVRDALNIHKRGET